MLTSILSVISVAFTIAIFALSSGKRIISFVAAGFWILLAVHAYTESLALWDVFYGLFMLSAIMVFACILVPAVLREKKEEDIHADDIDDDRDLMESIDATEKERDKYDRLFGKRRKKSKLSKFAKTGRD